MVIYISSKVYKLTAYKLLRSHISLSWIITSWFVVFFSHAHLYSNRLPELVIKAKRRRFIMEVEKPEANNYLIHIHYGTNSISNRVTQLKRISYALPTFLNHHIRFLVGTCHWIFSAIKYAIIIFLRERGTRKIYESSCSPNSIVFLLFSYRTRSSINKCVK